MSDEFLITKVRSADSGTLGRSANEIRHHRLTIDSSRLAEEITSSEAFLAGVSSCGVNLVQQAAHETNANLRAITVTIEGRRRADTPNWFARVLMHFTLTGPTQDEAVALVRRYQEGCPLYRTVAAATEVLVEVTAIPDAS